MKSIDITYNNNSFTLPPIVQEISLQSEFNYQSSYVIQSGNKVIDFKTRTDIIDFLEKIKGLNPNEISLFLLRNNYTDWNNSTFYEVQALKSLLLTFHWLDLSISNYEDLDVENIFYNEFIIDWSYHSNPQNTIYLLKKEYTSNLGFENHLQKLLELTLLCKIKLTFPHKTLDNFFIPLLTPGINAGLFKSAFDENGSKTNILWKNILNERSLRINDWLKNRF